VKGGPSLSSLFRFKNKLPFGGGKTGQSIKCGTDKKGILCGLPACKEREGHINYVGSMDFTNSGLKKEVNRESKED